MSTRQFVHQMKSLIIDAKARGTVAIGCDNLISYLSDVENSAAPEPTASEIERYKAELQDGIERNKYSQASQLEVFRSVITAGQGAIKSAFLLNGGAAVALLAFIGHLAQFKPSKVPAFSECLVFFAAGVLAAAATSGLTYLSQWFYASQSAPARTTGFVLNITCISLGLASYGLFSWGLLFTYRILSSFS